MMTDLLKRLAAGLPARWQEELKRLHFSREIRRGHFETSEPEFRMLESFLSPGDWAIDVGANIGHYTKRLSDLVGPTGRVLAFEPVSDTFALLTANAGMFAHRNVTLLNCAASNRSSIAGIQIPAFATGLKNNYEATLTAEPTDLQVLTLAIDSLGIPHRVRLIKIDAEGHESFVLQGMKELLQRDHPTLIVETHAPEVIAMLASIGYGQERLDRSPNIIFRSREAGAV